MPLAWVGFALQVQARFTFLTFLKITINSKVLAMSTSFLILSVPFTISCLLFLRFSLHGLLQPMHIYTQPSTNTLCITRQSHQHQSLFNYPTWLLTLFNYLLSHVTWAEHICATGLPQAAQISPFPPLYIYTLEETGGPASLELV